HERAGERGKRAHGIRQKGAENRKAPKGKLGGDSAGRWRAGRAGRQANGYSGGTRRRPEGCRGSSPGRHRGRDPSICVTGIRPEGQAEPSRHGAATPPPRWSAPAPGSALVSATLTGAHNTIKMAPRMTK